MAGDAPTPSPRPEPKIGSYHLVQPLGTGGMSSVFRALHVETGHEVAVKVLPRSLARNPTMLQRFLREARSAETLQHPNIVAIFDRGVDQGRHYIVLEYVDGGDLHDWVRGNSPIPVAEAVAIIRNVCEGLSYAANQGLIHRDIKPANLLRTRNNQIKIADLGLALQAEEEDERVTREGTTVGTVDYMAPEQARDSRATSLRSDIYSLGCTFYFLLTGLPPFGPGDVVEKLSRHCNAPIPDPRERRPDVPFELTLILRKMMAKRPENRYENYEELIAALDRLPRTATTGLPANPNGPAVLDALIDDEDDGPSSGNVWIPIQPPGLNAPAIEPRDVAPESADFSLVELARLDSDRLNSPRIPVDRPEPATTALALPVENRPMVSLPSGSSNPPPLRLPGPTAPVEAVFDDEDEAEEDQEPEQEKAVEGEMPGHFAFGATRRMTPAERSWVTRCVAFGIGLVVFVIAVHQLVLATKNDTNVSAPAPSQPVDDPLPAVANAKDEAAGAVVNVVPPLMATSRKTASPTLAGPARHPIPKVLPKSDAAIPTIWVEPVDPVPAPVAERTYDPAAEAPFRPAWSALESPETRAGKRAVIRRSPDPSDPEQFPTLRAALNVKGMGIIEVADNGPFFEADLHNIGDARIIRARPGFRPIICFDAPKLEILQQQTACLDLGEKSLLLDGLDLIVNVSDLPKTYRAIIQSQGGTLTLRNCSVTVVNRVGSSFSIVRTTGPAQRPSHIWFERCLLRGACFAAAELGAFPSELVFSRCLLVNSQGSAVFTEGTGTAERVSYFLRSVIATSGPAIEVADPPIGVRAHPMAVRGFGSTFAHLGSDQASFLFARGTTPRAAEVVQWSGAFNTYSGWSDWLSAGNLHVVRVRNLDAARAVWRGTDASSMERSASWPITSPASRATAVSFMTAAAARSDTLSRLPVPNPFLLERTIHPFPRPIVPGFPPGQVSTVASPGTIGRGSGPASLVASPTDILVPKPPIRFRAGVVPSKDPRSSGGVNASGAGTSPQSERELTFDTGSPPFLGDLGRFLASAFRSGDRLLRVKVTGSGPHAFTPVRVPEGVSLDLEVVPNPAGLAPSWTAQKGAEAEALLDLLDGSLRLSGVRLTRGGDSRLTRLVRVERGHLVLQNCRLLAPGTAEARGGGLVGFFAPGTRPLAALEGSGGPFPFGVPVDRPTCRITDSVLITGGDAIVAEVGRGNVALGQCAVAAGRTAFDLSPGQVARDRFDANLILDHCTVAAEQTFVGLESWSGTNPGPDRPWLVTTQNCAFFATYTPRNDSALLRVDPESFAHGTLFWQASNDAFEVSTFLATVAPGSPPARRHDVVRHWVNLWGTEHIRQATGPRLPAGLHTVRLYERLRPSDVDASDLAIDPESIPGRKAGDLGVDLTRLGIKPGSRTGHRR